MGATTKIKIFHFYEEALKRPLMDEYMNKIWDIRIMDSYSSFKKKEAYMLCMDEA